MTQRRRFFAATPVQTVPGQTVAVEVQLRKGSSPVVAAPVQDAQECVTWSSFYELDPVPDVHIPRPVLQPDGRWLVRAARYGGAFFDTYWVGVPPMASGLDMPDIGGLPDFVITLPSANWRCVHVEGAMPDRFLYGRTGSFFGIGLCVGADEIEWSGSFGTWERSIHAVSAGHTVVVMCYAPDGMDDESGLLEFNATLDGKPVGTLTADIRLIHW
jgi:hypothetical protein